MTMLEMLKEERVFSIMERAEFMGWGGTSSIPKPDYDFVILEECDRYFAVPITRAELRQLGEEILKMAAL